MSPIRSVASRGLGGAMFRYRNLGDWLSVAFFDSGVLWRFRQWSWRSRWCWGPSAVWRLARAWWKYRGGEDHLSRNQQAAGVVVDARHAAATALGKSPELRLSSCSRWPERAGCGQECLSQIEASPVECLVRNILTSGMRAKFARGAANLRRNRLGGAQAGAARRRWGLHRMERSSARATAGDAGGRVPGLLCLPHGQQVASEHPELAVDRARPK